MLQIEKNRGVYAGAKAISAKKLGTALFDFFASLKLAIFVLISLMAVFAAGTFIESWYGTETASLVIYQAPWFQALLFLLGVNVAAAALDRFPWKKRHTGFVITHIGILLMLAGSFISQAWMIDGQMVIREGESRSLISLNAPQIFLSSQAEEKEWEIDLKKHPFAWQGREYLKPGENSSALPFEITLLTYYPKSRREEKITEAVSGPAALQVTLHNSFVNQSQWLIQNHETLGFLQLGPAKIKFTHEKLQETKNAEPNVPYLEFQFLKQNVFLPLKPGSKLPAQFTLENTGYKVTISGLFKNAMVAGSQLIEQPADTQSQDEFGQNPAVQLMLEGEGIQERHTVFSKYPDFPTQHGMKASASGARLYYRMPGGGSRGQTHELRFIEENGGLIYQVQTGPQVKTGTVKLGEEIPVGWMDLNFRVEPFYPHAEIRQEFFPEPNNSTRDDARPAVQIQLKDQNQEKIIWLFQGVSQSFEWQGKTYKILFGEKQIPAGFRLELKDFRLETYPGTSNPASFESDVILKDDSRGVQRDTTISMNEPLIYEGYRIYQAGYSQTEGEKEVSVFSVGRDPGVPVKYLGAIVIILGMIIMFSMRKFSATTGKPL